MIKDRNLVVFTPRDIRRFLNISDQNTYRILGRMKDKGLVKSLQRGSYILQETYEEKDVYEIISQLIDSGYIAFWSALHFHNLTEQVPRKVFVASTRQKRPLEVQGQEVVFVRISESVFYGYERDGDVLVSDPEKTIVDCLRHVEYTGGIDQIRGALSPNLNVERMINYTEKLGNGAVAARLGFLLEKHNLLEGGSEGTERLLNLISSYTKLDPSREKGNPVRRWKLYANVDFGGEDDD